jgi:protein-tyrosine sulfotransferase
VDDCQSTRRTGYTALTRVGAAVVSGLERREGSRAPVFILSNPRSGSTLLRCLLDAHPDICSPGELALGALCRHLTVALETLSAKSDPWTEQSSPHHRRSVFEAARRVIEEPLRRCCEAQGKVRWCEKTPHNLEHLDYLNAVFPDAQCICLYRNPLDTVNSLRQTGQRSITLLEELSANSAGGGLEAFVTWWCRWTERQLAFESTFPSRCLRVRYEDLVYDTEDQLERILTFLELPSVDGIAARAFAGPYNASHGDPKIAGSNGTRTSAIGGGLRMDLTPLSIGIRHRVIRLMDSLAY